MFFDYQQSNIMIKHSKCFYPTLSKYIIVFGSRTHGLIIFLEQQVEKYPSFLPAPLQISFDVVTDIRKTLFLHNLICFCFVFYFKYFFFAMNTPVKQPCESHISITDEIERAVQL